MRPTLSIKAVGNAASLFLTISFALCVGLSLVFARRMMSSALQMWLPGSVWLTVPSFVLGLAESYAYGWLIAALWVPLYRFFLRCSEDRQEHETKPTTVGGSRR